MHIGFRFPYIVRPLLMTACAFVVSVAGALAQGSQEGFPRLSLELRGGVTSPKIQATGGSGAWEPGSTGSFGMNLGARPSRFVQFDLGLDVSLGAFDAQGTINTTGGARSISDREFLVTMGPRFILPSGDDTALLSFGFGYAYTHYAEIAQAQTNETIVGFTGGSRSGNGAYVFGQAEVAPSPRSPVTFGVRVGFVQSTTLGTRVGQFPGGVETTDRWPTVVGTIAFRGLR